MMRNSRLTEESRLGSRQPAHDVATWNRAALWATPVKIGTAIAVDTAADHGEQDLFGINDFASQQHLLGVKQVDHDRDDVPDITGLMQDLAGERSPDQRRGRSAQGQPLGQHAALMAVLRSPRVRSTIAELPTRFPDSRNCRNASPTEPST
jgi:hypothetical protein